MVNVCYNYHIIRQSAEKVQKSQKWVEDDNIQKLKFSNPWISNFLTRAHFRRRKITTADKKRPTEEEIRAVMAVGQGIYISNYHSPSTTWNFDETALTWAIGPTHLFIPANQSRANQLGDSNAKLRITAGITVSGQGKFAPLFIIIKHSVSSDARPDQRSMRVIPNLNNKPRFTEADGWKLKTWSRELTIKNKKQEDITATHYIYYLQHDTTGHVITSQHKAWNDTVRMAMFADVVMNSDYVDKTESGRRLLWMDNCGSHKTDAIVKLFHELDIDMALLPPNMTDLLQVLDLVVNGPIKAHIRNLRAERILTAFRDYKENVEREHELAQIEQRSPNFVKFSVPKPSMEQGIKDLIDLIENEFTEMEFKKGLVRSFTQTGMIPANDLSSFVEYTSKSSSGSIQVLKSTKFLDLSSRRSEVHIDSNEGEEHEVIRAGFEEYLDTDNFFIPNLEFEYDSDNYDSDSDEINITEE